MKNLILLAFLVFEVAHAQTARVGRYDELEKNNPALDFIEVNTDLEAQTTSAWRLPVGNDAARPTVTGGGWIRYNSEREKFEIYDGTEWIDATATGGGIDEWEAGVLYEVGAVVWLASDLKIYVCIEEHTSGMTFDPTKFDELSSDEAKLDKFPSETNDNRIARTDGNGNALQGSLVSIDDSGVMTGATQFSVDDLRLDGSTISANAFGTELNLTSSGDNVNVLKTLFTQDIVSDTGTSATIDNVIVSANAIGTTAGDLDISATGDITLDSVTANQVVFATTGDAITGSANFLYDSALDKLRVGELDFEDATISSIGTNQNITLDPNGTGLVGVPYLTDERLVFAGASGVLTDSADLSFDDATSVLSVDGIDIGNGSITTNATDADLNLDANGTGEINLQKATNISDGATIAYGTNTLDMNPSIDQSNLIAGASFEAGVIGNCTDATIAQVDATDGFATANSFKMGRITISDANGFCDFVGIGSEGNGTASILMKTAITDAQMCALVDGFEQQCISASATNVQPWKIPMILGGTSNSVRVKWGASTSGTIDIDDPTTKIGGIESVGYSNYTALDISGEAGFDSGTVWVARTGNVVSIAWGEIAHDNTNSVSTSAGFIPDWALPSDIARNVFNVSSVGTQRSFVFSTGVLQFAYLNNSGATVNRESANGGAISYVVAPEKASAVNGTMVRSDLLAIDTTDQSITSTESKITFATVESISNGSFSSNTFTVGQSGWYRLDFLTSLNRNTIDSSAFVVSAKFKINGVVVGAANCRTLMLYDDTSVTTQASSSRFQTMGCLRRLYIAQGSTVEVWMDSDQTINARWKTFSVEPAINPNGESIQARIDGYVQSPLTTQGNQSKFCIIRQSTATTTANFSSPQGCYAAGSRTGTGLYTGIQFTSGFFKTGTNVECVVSSVRQTADAGVVVCVPQQLSQEGDTFRVKCRNTADTDTDTPFSLMCHGIAP